MIFNLPLNLVPTLLVNLRDRKLYMGIDNNKTKQINVLLAEDNEVSRLLLHTTLEKWGAKVTAVENGKLAIDEVTTKTYDVILMDIDMPIMGGTEATKIIREELKLHTPIIALTINSDKEEYQKIGMNDFMSKPFESSILYDKIERLLKN